MGPPDQPTACFDSEMTAPNEDPRLAELVTGSYRLVAPKKLVKLVGS